MEVVLPAILAHIVNVVVPTRNQSGIIAWGIAMVVFSFGAWVLNFSANRMASGTASRAILSIRQDMFARAMRLSARQMDKLTVSSLESRLTTDTYALHRFLGATLRMGIRSLMLFIGGVFFCFWLSWRLALILLVLIVPLFFAIRFIYRRAIPLFHTVQRKLDDMVQIIRENIRGIRIIKALDWKSRSQKASAAAFKVHPRGRRRPPCAEYEGQLVLSQRFFELNVLVFS